MPALTRFTFGALNPLTVDDYTYREISEFLSQMNQYRSSGGVL